MVFRVDRVNRDIIISNFDKQKNKLVIAIDMSIVGCNVDR